MKRKLLALSLAAVMAVSLAACSSSTAPTQEAEPTEVETTVASPDTAEPEGTKADETEAAGETEKTGETEKADDEMLIRSTAFGDVKGTTKGDSLVWYGVPYGAAPIGELRWAAPEDPAEWTDILDCTEPAERALQFGKNYETNQNETIGTEDSLYLDIYSTTDAELRPVFVFIHGGNNQTGTSTEIEGSNIVVNDNCVYVSLSYRLGLLGFNCLPALHTEEGSTGNYTMLDLAKALDWIKANITAFGGDPNNITLSGFSAGGRDVMAALISPLFAGKFNKAIVFSGGMTVADEAASASQIAWALAPLAVEDGKAADEAAAHDWLLTDAAEVKDYLFSITSDRLAPLMGNAGIRMSAFPHLYTDGIVLPKEGFDTTTYNSVPVIMVTGTDEFSMFAGFDAYYSSDAVKALDEDTQAAAKTFAVRYGSDMYRIFNAQCSAEKMSANYDSDIYIVQIDYDDVPTLGSFHGIFVPMFTGEHGYLSFSDFASAGYKDMAAKFNGYIANFLATGDPNSEEFGGWTPWTPDSKQSMIFDADDTTATAEMKDVSSTYEEIIAAMEADDTISDEVKLLDIQNVMNGRWFSAALDEHYGNPTLWK